METWRKYNKMLFVFLKCFFVEVAKLSEVKGPRDRLSDKQRAWIDYLLDNGVEVELCLVKESNK